MMRRFLMFTVGVLLTVDTGFAQNIPPTVPAKPPTDTAPARTWRPPSGERVARSNPDDATLPQAPESLRPVDRNRQPIAKVTNGPGTLPNDAGQVWREYDISPYTSRVTSTNRPEQAIVDWVLREIKLAIG